MKRPAWPEFVKRPLRAIGLVDVVPVYVVDTDHALEGATLTRVGRGVIRVTYLAKPVRRANRAERRDHDRKARRHG
jgi:hypothetical protein